MRIKIQEDKNRTDTEIIIYCPKADERVRHMEELIISALEKERMIALLQKGNEYYLPLSSILFFETSGSKIEAHTVSDMYETDHKLYQLEEMLPGSFQRISKSTIANVNCICAVSRNLTASSAVEFYGTHKQVYVSRRYFKLLKERLEEKRIQL